MIRVLLAGSRWFGMAVFAALREAGHEVVAIWDRTPSRLAEAARAAGVKVLASERIGDPGWLPAMPELVTGGTVYWLTDHADAGPILMQDWCFVRPDDSPESLWRCELAPMGVRLLVESCSRVATGTAPKRQQDENMATWEPTFRRPNLATGD